MTTSWSPNSWKLINFQLLIIFQNENSLPLWSTKNCSDLILGLCILPRLKDETIDQDENSGLESGINSPMMAINMDTDINLEIHINSVSSSSTILISVIILPLLVLGHSQR